MNALVSRLLPCLLATTLLSASDAFAADWRDALKQQVERIDRESPGSLGLYVKRLDTGESLDYQASRRWYLGSAVKLPIALALMQEVEGGKLALTDKLTLKGSDKIDGSGGTVWEPAGTTFTVDAMLEEMLMKSDNTSANMLIRAIGEDTMNQRAKALLGAKNLDRITNFSDVRYDVYSELTPRVREIPSAELVKLASAPMGPQRVTALRRMLSLDARQLKVPTIEEAYARYYKRGLNSTTLVAYGGMLENFVQGKVVSPEHKDLLFKYLKFDTYDAYRLEAGLPRTVRFIHKTGTQLRRACHTGVISPEDMARHAIVVVACAEELDEHDEAGQAFERIGRAITQTLLQTTQATLQPAPKGP